MLLAAAASSCFCLLTHHWSCLKPFWLVKEAPGSEISPIFLFLAGSVWLCMCLLGTLPNWDTGFLHSPQTSSIWLQIQFCDVTVLTYKWRDDRFPSLFFDDLFFVTVIFVCHLWVYCALKLAVLHLTIISAFTGTKSFGFVLNELMFKAKSN